jgi:hypothetical protein
LSGIKSVAPSVMALASRGLVSRVLPGRNHDAKETISLGVLTFSSFENASQKCGLVRICQHQQSRVSLTMIHRCFT